MTQPSEPLDTGWLGCAVLAAIVAVAWALSH